MRDVADKRRSGRQETEDAANRPAAALNGWHRERLGEVCNIASALVDPREPKYSEKIHVGGANIESTTGELIDLKTAKQEGLKSGKFVFDETMVLYSKIRPYLMKVARPEFQGLCSADIYPLSPNSSRLDRNYLYHLLLSAEFTEFAVAGSARAGMPKVNRDHLFTYRVHLPPLAEQRRIVGILDEAFDGIATAKANAEKNLQNARALFESHLQAVFTLRGSGYLEKPLGECVHDISTGPFGSILHKADYEHGGIPLVNPINIEGDEIIPDDRKAVGKATAQRLARYALSENDIVIGRRGEIGRCAVVARNQAGWLCGTGCFVIRPSEKTDPRFLTHLLRSRPYRQRLERVAARATMPSISNDDLANLVIGLPPLAEQRRTLALIEDLSAETQRLESLYEKKLAALGELKKSLLHRAFSGQL